MGVEMEEWNNGIMTECENGRMNLGSTVEADTAPGAAFIVIDVL